MIEGIVQLTYQIENCAPSGLVKNSNSIIAPQSMNYEQCRILLFELFIIQLRLRPYEQL